MVLPRQKLVKAGRPPRFFEWASEALALQFRRGNPARSRRAQCPGTYRRPQKAADPARSGSDANFVCGRLKLGRRRGEAWPSASILLATGDFAFLHSTSGGGDLFE